MDSTRSAWGMNALELNRTFAMSAAWDEAAAALARLDVPAYETAMSKFQKIAKENRK